MYTYGVGDPEVGEGRGGVMASAISPIHYCFPSEIEITVSCNLSEDESWRGVEVSFCFCPPMFDWNGAMAGFHLLDLPHTANAFYSSVGITKVRPT